MIYLKFAVMQGDNEPLAERVYCSKGYTVMSVDGGWRIYYEPGMWEEVSDDAWLNCFVMSETGKTIGVYHPRRADGKAA